MGTPGVTLAFHRTGRGWHRGHRIPRLVDVDSARFIELAVYPEHRDNLAKTLERLEGVVASRRP